MPINFLQGKGDMGEAEEPKKKTEEELEIQMTKPVIDKKSSWLSSIFKKKKISLVKKPEKRKEVSGSPESGVPGLDISLMPEKTVIIPRIIYSRTLILIAVLVVIITIFSITWLYFDWHFEKIKNEIEKIEREMRLVEVQTLSLLAVRDEVAKLEANAAQTEKILNNHIYWTKFFGLLEKYTTGNVYFGDFSADTSGIIRLDSVGKDLVSIAQQIVVFSQATDFIKEVGVSDVANAPLGVKAMFSLVLVDNVFKR